MASSRQIAANNRNAQYSTGPNTGDGKRASRMNALKHGMTATPNCNTDDLATAVVLVKEPPASFENYFRYEASIERGLYRAISALERLQARRTRQERQNRGRTQEAPLMAGSASGPRY